MLYSIPCIVVGSLVPRPLPETPCFSLEEPGYKASSLVDVTYKCVSLTFSISGIGSSSVNCCWSLSRDCKRNKEYVVNMRGEEEGEGRGKGRKTESGYVEESAVIVWLWNLPSPSPACSPAVSSPSPGPSCAALG